MEKTEGIRRNLMKVIWDGYISDIPEVMEELNNRYEMNIDFKLDIENIRG